MRSTPNKPKCSYCSISSGKCKVMIESPNKKANICANCIAVCVKLMADNLVLPGERA